MSANSTLSIDEILEDVKAFLPRLIEACESVAELLYKPMHDEAWAIFGELVQGMDDLYRTLNTVNGGLMAEDTNGLFKPVIEDFLADMAKKFAEMNRLMDEEEYAVAGDCIHYELTALFSELSIALGEEAAVRRNRLDANLAYLKEHFPRAYEQIQALSRDTKRYRIVTAKNGSPNLHITPADGKAVYLYSRYEPEHEAVRWVESITDEVSGKENVMFYGFGLGYHLFKFVESFPASHLHVYEPDPQILLAAMEVIDLAELFDRPQMKDFVVGENKDHRDGLFYRLLKYGKGETATIPVPVYDKLSAQWKQVFFEDAKNAIYNYVSSENMYEKFGLEWTRNSLYNMALNVTTPPIGGLRGKADGLPAVIVGAGPSLEADIELLRELKRHAVIIAAGTAVQSLQHHGIDPHLVVSFDGGAPNGYVFKTVDIKEIPLLYAPQVHHEVLEDTSDKLFHVFLNTDVTTMYLVGLKEGDTVFKSTHSVTGTAIQAAAFLGCSEIIFTGQDLSYPAERLYAGGAKHVSDEHTASILSRAVLQVENVNGSYNRTTDSMRLTLVDIEEIISMYPEIRFVNTSRTGAKIKHTVWQPMDDVLARLKDVHVEPDYMSAIMASHLAPYSEARIQEMIERVFSLPEQLAEFEDKIKRIKRMMEKLPELSRKKPDKCISAMVDIEENWGVAVKSLMFNTFFLTLLKKEISHFDRELPEVAGETNLIKKATLFVEIVGTLVNALYDKIPTVKDMLNETVRRIRLRMGHIEGEQSHVWE
ncbi:MAG TPA: 6-hydroxymethylpterin diphosphokinase MptE-like protein [Paenibacillus sp.]|uniref:motility associated factor glycosyltransferase family protein n=1 Tax=Paenibacillus sp. TaxID=58172 RepID=UPI002CA5F582|nr:6-hydroxymethylpterin diphosphokinase MptE-like protein [Paenibacillus sp.]HUC91992.1 6-hydroxymethylpterin diphosphokinase MptE-like protein [Paenibacillus sp.]